jgi:hypothetical protein
MKIPFGRRNWERRMDTELRFHLDQQIREYMERGLSRAEAERHARQEFGTLELAKDECRDQRTAEWLNNILRDVRHASAVAQYPLASPLPLPPPSLGIAFTIFIDHLLLLSLPTCAAGPCGGSTLAASSRAASAQPTNG